MTKHMDRAAEALRGSRVFQASAAFGVPHGAWEDCSRMMLSASLRAYHALREWSPEELAEFPEGSVMLHPEMGLLERDFRPGWVGFIEWGNISNKYLAERGPMRLVFNPDDVKETA